MKKIAVWTSNGISLLLCCILVSACTEKEVSVTSSPHNQTGKPTSQPTSVVTASPTIPAKTTSPTPSPSPTTAGSNKVILENQAFRIFEPAPDSQVGQSFKVRGQARVFEAAFSYNFEDGHNVLAEGHVMAKQGAPAWGDFEFTVTFNKATSPTGILTIYEISAKDGTHINQLHIPLKIKEPFITSKP